MTRIINISPARRQQLMADATTAIFRHPVRPLAITVCGEGILESRFITDADNTSLQPDDKTDRPTIDRHALDNLPLLITASPFAEDIYNALMTVGPATTITYGRLAALAHHPGAARAVGTAMARNRHPWLIPCHRVVPADGSPGNYTPDPTIKPLLLALEQNLGR